MSIHNFKVFIIVLLFSYTVAIFIIFQYRFSYTRNIVDLFFKQTALYYRKKQRCVFRGHEYVDTLYVYFFSLKCYNICIVSFVL